MSKELEEMSGENSALNKKINEISKENRRYKSQIEIYELHNSKSLNEDDINLSLFYKEKISSLNIKLEKYQKQIQELLDQLNTIMPQFIKSKVKNWEINVEMGMVK